MIGNITWHVSASPLIQGSSLPGNIQTWRSTSQRTAMLTSLPMTIPGLFLHLWRVRNKCLFHTGKSYKHIAELIECYADDVEFSLSALTCLCLTGSIPQESLAVTTSMATTSMATEGRMLILPHRGPCQRHWVTSGGWCGSKGPAPLWWWHVSKKSQG